MTLKSEVEEMLGRYRNAYFLAASAAMGSVFFGYDIGIIGGVIALPSFKAGNIVAILQGGCFFGALGVGYFSNRWGRKPCMVAAGLIYIVGSVIQAAVHSAAFFAGLGVGMMSALVPSYVSECTLRAICGRCTGMIQLANNVGIMISCAYALRI
ncbi:general substrate transporter [Mycena rosella]|uniref:General substrate transporter n=1 Tax=Mycena rosella TaxID=1033263 RepID=A0AAD7GXY8_MYCRO|nr:general substrate transporter [Mycena rosella]